ncbi:paraneoplastic antigen Ma6E [Drosophila rhopaloa]|uniref:Glycine-rich protein 5 n=1 Tax=Drosophila rhopaloa TaxID=1041015 RepID=A0A6P4E1Y2_DRORH|nr:paraneoplastic antigen Ma6E [Drosophila rhopaloa]
MKVAIVSCITLAMLLCIAEAQVPGQPEAMSAAQGGVGTAAGVGKQVGAHGDGAAAAAEDGPGAGMSAGIGAGGEVGANAQAGGAGAGRRR